MYRKRTVEDLRAITHAGQQDAVQLLRDCLQKAQQEWMESDDIFPPHFIGGHPLKEEPIKKSLIQLYEQGAMRDPNYGRQDNMTLFKLQYRRMRFSRARWAKENKQVMAPLNNALAEAAKRCNQGKVSLQQLSGKRDIDSPVNFDIDTIPFEEISMIYVNPDPHANGLTICGRSRRENKMRVPEPTDPVDHGFYLPRRSASDSIDVLLLGIDRITLRAQGGGGGY